MADETAECTCDVDNGWPCDRHSTLTAGKVRLAAQTLVLKMLDQEKDSGQDRR